MTQPEKPSAAQYVSRVYEEILTFAADAAFRAGPHPDPEQEAARQRILERFYKP